MSTQNKQTIRQAEITSSLNSIVPNSIQVQQSLQSIDQGLVSKLKKIPKQNKQEKKNAIIKFITKDINKNKQFQKLQSQKTNLPVLEAAINLGKYGQNSAYDQIIDKSQFNSIQLKSPRLIKNNPFTSLLSLSKSKLLQKKKETSFIQYICKSPKDKNFVKSNKKTQNQSLMNSNVKTKISIQFPKELKQLKKQLYELPCVSRDLEKQKTEPIINNAKQKIKNIKDLCRSYHMQKKDNFFQQDQNVALQNSLIKALSQRKYKTQASVQFKLPPIKFNQKAKSKFKQSRQKYFKSLSSIFDQSSTKITKDSETILKFSKSRNIQNPQNDQSIQNTQIYEFKTQKNDQFKTIQKKNDLINYQKRTSGKFWPYYKKFSPYNDKILQKRVKQMGVNIKQFLQFTSPPSQQTMKIFQAIRILQKQQDDYLKKQVIYNQKNMSQTKYNLKLTNLKESYIKDMKQFINNRRMNSIQRRKRDFQQNQNMSKRIIKLNQKIIQKLKIQQEKQKRTQQDFQKELLIQQKREKQ